jgi:hypothetical protein
MPRRTVDETTVIEELRRVPEERWSDVLTFLRSLQPGRDLRAAERPVLSGADLAGSELIGIWADRTDIVDSREFAHQLRHRAEHRRRTRSA